MTQIKEALQDLNEIVKKYGDDWSYEDTGDWMVKHFDTVCQCLKHYEAIEEIAMASPELNPCNYDHDQVCELNSAMVEICTIFVTARGVK